LHYSNNKIRTADSEMAKVIAIYMRLYIETLMEIVEPFLSNQVIEESIERLKRVLPQNLKADVTCQSLLYENLGQVNKYK
jgi:hypothetical protein